MTQRPALVALLATAALATQACSKPNEAELAATDKALQGQVVDGQLAAVATRVVMVGGDGPRAPACATTLRPRDSAANAHWSPNRASPVKAGITGEVASCEREGGWVGVVFPAHGQDLADCLVATPVRSPREYQGPCRWGWVEASALMAAED